MANALFVLMMAFSLPETARIVPKLSALRGESHLSYELVHPLHKVVATTREFRCEIELAEETQEIRAVQFRANVASFDSGNSNRDAHALEVVEALLYPEVRFESERIETEQDQLRVSGKLTFHGVTQTINFTAQKKTIGSKLRVQGTTEISLTAFKVERPALLFVKVEDALKISFDMAFELP